MTRDSQSARDSREHSERNDARILKELGGPGQKGGPSSLPDLIELGTLDLELAAWLVSHISRGASLVVSAGPGGIGKTTILRALLSFAPGNRPFALALPGKIRELNGAARCIITHESATMSRRSISGGGTCGSSSRFRSRARCWRGPCTPTSLTKPTPR